MQMDSALSATRQGADRTTANRLPVADDATVAQRAASAAAVTSTISATSAQDDAVHISAEGAAAATAEQEGNAGQHEAGSDSTTAESAPASGAAAVQSFAYGALGLERPDQPHEERNPFYTAGRWLAAGITVGGILSLLV
jgi:hypothetical protein